MILLHGSMLAAQDLMKLATAVADEFTVTVPDRRGRGLSGPHGDRYGIDREVEDLQALLKETGAARVFGLSSGARARPRRPSPSRSAASERIGCSARSRCSSSSR